MELKRGPIPLYYQLERILRKRIQSGEFDGSRPLPTENELCEKYGVSRITVRQAVMILESDGLLKREQGRGTFAVERDHEDIPYRLYGYADDVFLIGSKTRLELNAGKSVRLNTRTARDMELNEGDEAILFEGIRYFDAEKYKALFHAWVPKKIGEKISRRKLKGPHLIALVEQVSLERVKRVHQVISAAVATRRHEIAINVKVGHPLLIIKHIYVSGAGAVLEVAETHFPGDKFKPKGILERVSSKYPKYDFSQIR